MPTIEKLWFDSERIWIQTDDLQKFSRPLEAFPTLKDASNEERMSFKINNLKDSIHWEQIDEDIHISSFFEEQEPNYENEIALIFKKFPQLNISEVANSIGIHKSLLAKYIYGIKKPSEQRKQEIKNALHDLGKELLAV